MADITWADVTGPTGMFPDDAALGAVPVQAQAIILGRVNRLSAQFFGGVDSDKYKLARIYLAAHLGAGGGVGGNAAAGPVTSESEGGVSRSYAVVPGAVSGSHNGTSYGRLYDELVRSSPYRILGGCS